MNGWQPRGLRGVRGVCAGRAETQGCTYEVCEAQTPRAEKEPEEKTLARTVCFRIYNIFAFRMIPNHLMRAKRKKKTLPRACGYLGPQIVLGNLYKKSSHLFYWLVVAQNLHKIQILCVQLLLQRQEKILLSVSGNP